MENNFKTSMKQDQCNEDFKYLVQKTKRDEFKPNPHQLNYDKKWIPYKHMKYQEKKRLMDKASIKDHSKQVKIIYNNLGF